MIKKIIKILNTGRFKNFNASGDVEFKKVTTIFAENGRGKTTLSAIFRSLKTNDPVYITERSTLGIEESPQISIKVDTGNLIFKNHWDQAYTNIEIFDSTFINDNVFSGEHIDHDHKKNLYRFVVGEEGVKLAHQVDELDKKIRENNNNITVKAAGIQKYIIGSELAVNDFLNLASDENIKKKISDKEKEIEILKKAKQILLKVNLQKIVLPQYENTIISEILNKQLTGISKEAEEKTKEHIKQHLDRDGESWIEKGIGYTDQNCPFCSQSISQNDLVESYMNYFDTSYKQHKENIVNVSIKFKNNFSESALSHIKQIFNSNITLIEFWKEYIELDENLGIFFEEVETALKNLSQEVIDYLRQKHLAPLDIIVKKQSLQDYELAYEEIIRQIQTYNLNVEKINEAIQKKKLEASTGDLQNASKELDKFKNISSRYEQEANSLCIAYSRLLNDKKILQKKKEEAKKQLDLYTEKIFQQYQRTINGYLELFGAGFEVVDSKTAYSGGSPSSNYCIKINEIAVGLGDTRTYGKPCFRNILSQGDKNALAFAFFLARLDQDINIGEKIIVFDDPISSLDGHRKTCTEQEIFKKAEKARQCIIMSHDKYFLRSIWNKELPENVKALQIERTTDGSKISEWDIMSGTKGDYFDDFYSLKKFNESGVVDEDKRRAVARCIRPVLEGYLRIKFPEYFRPNEWLGDFISTLESGKITKIVQFKDSHLQDLKDINDYSKKYHHKDNPSADRVSINDSELNTYVKRTFRLINN